MRIIEKFKFHQSFYLIIPKTLNLWSEKLIFKKTLKH